MKKPKKKFQHLICFHVSGEMKVAVERIAHAKQWSRALVIRAALAEYIKKEFDGGEK